jgi:hypothetical protein
MAFTGKFIAILKFIYSSASCSCRPEHAGEVVCDLFRWQQTAKRNTQPNHRKLIRREPQMIMAPFLR